MAVEELAPAEWFEELNRGRDFRRRFGIEETWAEIEAMFYNVDPSNNNSGPNIIMSMGDSLMSLLSVPVPQFLVGARRQEHVRAARVLESLDNGLVKDLELQDEIDTAILHTFLWGRGILKIGYDSEWGWNPKFDFGRRKTGELGLTMTQFDDAGRRIEFEDVRPGMPWVRSCLPHDIIVPYGTRDLRSAEWIAHRVVRHVDDIKADTKYSGKKSLQPVMSMEDFVKSYTTAPKSYRAGEGLGTSNVSRADRGQKEEYCELYEIHDRRTGRVLVVATGHKRFLRNEPDMLQLDGLPFVEVGFIPGARAFWTTPDAHYLRHSHAELADVSIQSTKQRRLSTLKWLYDSMAIDDDELEKAISANVGPAVRVTSGMLEAAVKPFTANNNNQMLYMDAAYIRGNAREITGLSRNQMGEYDPKSRISATETAAVQSGSSQRSGRRSRKVGIIYERIMRKVNAIVFKYWKTPRWIEVVGETGLREWVQYKGPELAGDYTYDVFFSPINVPSLTARQQRGMQLYSVLAQRKDPSLVDQFLNEAFNDPELREVFQNAGVSPQVPGMRPGGGTNPPGGFEG